MQNSLNISDPVFVPAERSALERRFLRYIKDERDLPFVWLILRISLSVVPLAVALFLVPLGIVWGILGAAFIFLLVYFLGPFTLMLHNTSHRTLFKSEYKKGNLLIPWVLCPFMGQSPQTYFSHHIGMHHAENNLPPDKSATILYRRDSLVDFLKYFFRFLFVGIIEMSGYFRQSNKRKFLKNAVVGELLFLGMCVGLSFVSLPATLLVFVLPLIIVRFAMMSGNWAQHAFVDPAAPADNYRNSITCINTVYNQKCFNDGYHIGHHLKPHMHWTDMPVDFQKNADKYGENQAIVFESLDYHQIWWKLMNKRYDQLAEHVVDLGHNFRSKEEIVALLQSRTQPIAWPTGS